MKRFFYLMLALALLACQAPEQPQSLDAELERDSALYPLYRSQHPEFSEDEAQRRFQTLLKLKRAALEKDPKRASLAARWGENRALAQAWLAKEIEERYHPEAVDDAVLQAAIEAYAFDTGHPALVTVSQLLLGPDDESDAQSRHAALEQIRQGLLALPEIDDEALRQASLELLKAGYHVDFNADLSFPRYPLKSFMGERLNAHSVVEPFAKAAFELSTDKPLSPIVETDFGLHLILFKSKKDEEKASLDAERERLRAAIVQHARSTALHQALQELQQQFKIRVDAESLQP